MRRRTLLAMTLAAGAAHAAEPRVITRGDARIAYHADGVGRLLVLIPSLGRGAEDFDGIAPLLAREGFRVLRPEPRGIGASSALPPGATLHDMAADVAVVIEAEGGGPAVVAGHAAGNWVARVLAHDRPDLVRGVAMVAALLGTTVDPTIRESINGSFDMRLSDDQRLQHLRRAYFAPGNDARVWLAGWHPEVAARQREAATATQDRAWLRAATAKPLLYLGAAQDTISPPPTLEALRAAVGPMAVLDVIGNAGHALVPEQPAATAAALAAWAKALP